MLNLSPKHIRALTWVVGEAETWRGSLMGHYPDDPESIKAEKNRLRNFDREMKLAREALYEVRRLFTEQTRGNLNAKP